MIERSPGGLINEESLAKNSEEERVFNEDQNLSYSQINPENVSDIYNLLNQEITQPPDGKMDRAAFQALAMERYKQHLESFGVGTLEQKMLGTFWNIGNIAEGNHQRQTLREELDFADRKRRGEIFAEINRLNIETANWQNEIAKLTLNLANDENGRKNY
jgi:hypothetical protein